MCLEIRRLFQKGFDPIVHLQDRCTSWLQYAMVCSMFISKHGHFSEIDDCKSFWFIGHTFLDKDRSVDHLAFDDCTKRSTGKGG